ncbi:sensor histidine kinase [Bacillus sp. HMF5848]|uniref:sensor histidine kinase n=1 Tax=Bacillus sp. HMF5848 TaxID=2495421 RepID=UPI000F792072|nr:sensor histidine kinase [Bacillus sp. HMF5848]RSK29146.1 sensor histidine kinase [Bacillus sp. HMF5848]
MSSLIGSHWGHRVLFYTRMIWVLMHWIVLVFFYQSEIENSYLLFFSALIAGVIPQLIWLKSERMNKWIYPVLELTLSGLFLLYSSYEIGKYFSYIAIPAMCAAAQIHTVRLRVPLWIWFSIIPSITMALVTPLSSFNLAILEGFLFFGLGCIIWKIIHVQQKMQHLLDENEQQRQVLEQYAKQVETITLLEERNRLARELHDTVGHTLTSVIMGLDAVSYLVKTEPDEAQMSLKQLRDAASKGLDEVREQIHHIVPLADEEPLLIKLNKIAEEFALYTGTKIDFNHVGADVVVPLPIKMIFVRCMQESLTNAKRHGGANQIQITLTLQSNQISLTIHDNGRGTENLQYGYGLTKMRERIDAYHGELEIKSGENIGTTVHCQLPLKYRKVG